MTESNLEYPKITLEKELQSHLKFEAIIRIESLQSLWSGYGTLLRVFLSGYKQNSIIVKRISTPTKFNHPRGWFTDIGHERKLRSYEVEFNSYKNFHYQLDVNCKSPALLGHQNFEDHTLLILEDLAALGYTKVYQDLSSIQIKKCLDWLASFHARFIHIEPQDLWPIGTYWQLDTRKNELKAMEDGVLKSAAQSIHNALNSSQFKTLVHGDAKYANFCFSDNDDVAAVDFQYVGGGCGIKDVAYLLSCIEGGIGSQSEEDEYLAHYFRALNENIQQNDKGLKLHELETEWRYLYPFAYADFERFLVGWSPGHWKSNIYSKTQVDKTINLLMKK